VTAIASEQKEGNERGDGKGDGDDVEAAGVIAGGRLEPADCIRAYETAEIAERVDERDAGRSAGAISAEPPPTGRPPLRMLMQIPTKETVHI